ncbi:MAG: hypothetical protein KC583_24040 [Myxococcales bacterium]|nr:hypothetical protein [Myxococcales bacterium]
MIRFDPQGLGGPHVFQFVREKGSRLLALLGERAAADAPWEIHSHGAWIRVEAEADAAPFFERRVVLLVRPEDQAPDTFSGWAEGRLEHLGRYLEACNTGRVVRSVVQERSVTAIVMGRKGVDPNAPGVELPPAGAIPALLADFTANVERYLRLLGDPDLRYVMALRLYRVPRGDRPADFVLGLDALPTVVGLTAEAVPIPPASLVRGVVGELARQQADRADELASTRSPLRPVDWLRSTHALRRLEALVAALDDVVLRIDATGMPDMPTIRGWLNAIELPRWPLARPAAAVGLGVVLVSVAAAVAF